MTPSGLDANQRPAGYESYELPRDCDRRSRLDSAGSATRHCGVKARTEAETPRFWLEVAGAGLEPATSGL